VDGAAFSALVTCAYGAQRRGCDATPVCDQATSAALTREAGTWSGARACVVAAGRAHDTVTPKRLVAEQAPRLRHRRLSQRVDGAGLLVGLIAAGILIARRRRPRAERPAPPAPWPRGQLYAALVRSLLWSILLAALIAGAMGRAHHAPSGEAITLLIYLLLLLWMARLVFRRFGLSWRDSLGWPRAGAARDVGLALLATIGLGRAGSACIALIATAAGIHVPWSDMTPPLDPTAPLRLVVSVVSTVVMPALTEELLFRRAIFTALKRRWAPPIAAVVSAALFALPHGYSWIGLAMMLWLGLVAAWAFNRTGSLWPCIGAHAYGNAIAVWTSII
jgi:membrane protease YdiL (CAAX protease family)